MRGFLAQITNNEELRPIISSISDVHDKTNTVSLGSSTNGGVYLYITGSGFDYENIISTKVMIGAKVCEMKCNNTNLFRFVINTSAIDELTSRNKLVCTTPAIAEGKFPISVVTANGKTSDCHKPGGCHITYRIGTFFPLFL